MPYLSEIEDDYVLGDLKVFREFDVSHFISNARTALSGKASTSHTHSLDDVSETAAKKIMTADERTKLSGIATGANKTTVDAALSSSSTNPVQNKVINTALAGKASTSHNHDSAYIAK